VTEPGKVTGIGAAQVLLVVVRLTPVTVLVVGLVAHVSVGLHWSLVILFIKPAANYTVLASYAKIGSHL